jgi:hypothetical protein
LLGFQFQKSRQNPDEPYTIASIVPRVHLVLRGSCRLPPSPIDPDLARRASSQRVGKFMSMTSSTPWMASRSTASCQSRFRSLLNTPTPAFAPSLTRPEPRSDAASRHTFSPAAPLPLLPPPPPTERAGPDGRAAAAAGDGPGPGRAAHHRPPPRPHPLTPPAHAIPDGRRAPGPRWSGHRGYR